MPVVVFGPSSRAIVAADAGPRPHPAHRCRSGRRNHALQDALRLEGEFACAEPPLATVTNQLVRPTAT